MKLVTFAVSTPVGVFERGNHRAILGPEEDAMWPRCTQQLEATP